MICDDDKTMLINTLQHLKNPTLMSKGADTAAKTSDAAAKKTSRAWLEFGPGCKTGNEFWQFGGGAMANWHDLQGLDDFCAYAVTFHCSELQLIAWEEHVEEICVTEVAQGSFNLNI